MTKSDFVSAKRVLVYRLGSLGDTVVALPCLHLIARTFPNAERRMLTNFPVHAKAPASAAVIGDSGLIHGYMRYVAGTRSPIELGKVWWQIRRWNPDVMVYLMPVRPMPAVKRDTLFFKLAGVTNIVGVPTSATDLVPISLDGTQRMYESEARRLARMMSPLGDANVGDLANWDLRLTAAERSRASEVLRPFAAKPFLVCAPGTKMQSKDWGAENWSALMGRLYQRFPDHALALVGAGEERATCDTVGVGWGGQTLNLCGELSPRETAAVVENAVIFMGPDSGPMHLAAAVGTPCAIAFSARGNPGIWFPEGKHHQVVYHQVDCFGCLLETCTVERKKCLTSISVDEMFQAALTAYGHATQQQALSV